ncbi:MAG: hypothetical protein LBQ87_07085 [Candidatus Fibromonas sp.]|nr:hypothetical protein [Candidatus Fibromonas sp.]
MRFSMLNKNSIIVALLLLFKICNSETNTVDSSCVSSAKEPVKDESICEEMIWKRAGLPPVTMQKCHRTFDWGKHYAMKSEKTESYRDSSIYNDGQWELLESDKELGMLRSLTSTGVLIMNLYDLQGKVETGIMLDKNKNIISLRRYTWKDGRLIQTVFNGTVRNFDYGKTPCDTVKVTPPDEGIDFHHGFNNSYGIIPYENDDGYRFFIKGPYSFSGGMAQTNKEQKRLCEEYRKKSQKKKKSQ